MLAVDTETRSLAYREGSCSVFMVQWADAHGEYVCDENTGWQPFLDAIADDDFLVFANASFDIHHLRASGIVDLLTSGHRCHDVQTLARVAIPGRYQYKLEGLGTDLLGADHTEQQRALKEAAKLHKIRWTQEEKDYYGLWLLEPEPMEKYGREDVRLTFDLWNRIWPRTSPTDREVYRMEIAGVAPILRASERDGVRVDQERLAVLKARLIEERDELRCRLLAQGISEEALGTAADTHRLLSREGDFVQDADGELAPNPDAGLETWGYEKVPASSKALLADLLAAGVPLYRKTPKSGEVNEKTGKRNPDQLAVNKDALTEFKVRFPVVADLMKWRGHNLLLRTYVGALEEADPNVHTSFSQAEARTSRMSSSRPNVQNLPSAEEEAADGTFTVGVRDVLVPAPGDAIIVGDYDSIEVRMLAHYIAIDELSEFIEAGGDLYARTAALVAQRAGKRDVTYESCCKGGKHEKSLRGPSKITTLTSMYGGGARLLGTRLGISTEEAAFIKRETLDAIPGYWELDERVRRAVRDRAFPHVISILGRRLYVPKDKPYVALNTILQGSSAEVMKLGMIAAAPVLAEMDYRIILIVHDELVATGPASCAEQALSAMLRAMESVYPLRPRLSAAGGWSTDSYGRAK